MGYEIVRPGAVRSVSDTAVMERIRTVRPFTMLSDIRLQSIHDQVWHLQTKEIPGALVECGVWRGGSAGMAALAVLAQGGTIRHLHLFDTFAGIPEPDAAVDGERAVREADSWGVKPLGRLVANPQFYANQGRQTGLLEDSEGLLGSTIGYPMDYVHYYKGFFQDTVAQGTGQIGPIAFLHLDGDWYESTRVCLEHLYDLVVPGGLIAIDDYGAYEGCKRAVDEFVQKRGLKVYLHSVDDEARSLSKP